MMDRSDFLKTVRATGGLILLGAVFPSIAMAQTSVQIKRGPLAQMPLLMAGQLCHATDVNLLFIGTANGNVQLGGRWLFCATNPTSNVGTIGDWAVDAAGMSWQKTAAGWVQRVSLVGPAGAAGLAGKDGKDGAPSIATNREVVGISLPAIGLGLTKNVEVAWATPLPSANFGIHYQLWPATTGITLSLGVSVVAGSKTPTGCTLAVRAVSALAANTGTLDFSAIHSSL